MTQESSEWLTVDEVAAILKLSRRTVIRHFERIAGVVNLSTTTNGRRRGLRRYRVLRIPRIELTRYLNDLRIR